MIPLLLVLFFQPVYQTTYPMPPPVVLQERMTPLKLLQRHHKVVQGTVCFYPLEVKCIDNVCGESPNSYWEVSVNGNTKNYNANSTVMLSDITVWHFCSLNQAAQKSPVHSDSQAPNYHLSSSKGK